MSEPETLSPSQRSRIRRRSQPKELSPDEEGGELNIVPFLDIIMNVLMFVLATVATTFTATIDAAPPKSGGRGAAGAPSFSLTVLVVKDGVSIKARGGNVGPGCELSGGTGYAIGMATSADGKRDYDWAALNRCAKKVKSQVGGADSETSVTVAANPEITYQTIINTLDALRKDDAGGDLFPDVQFGVAGGS